MTSKLDSRQSRQRAVLDQLSNSTDLRLDAILNLINDELTAPLRLKASITPDRKVYIGNIEVQTLDGVIGTGRRRTIQPISNLLPSFTAGYLELPSASGGSITSDQGAAWFQSTYTLTLAANQYIKIMIALSSQGKVVLSFGASGASESAATMPIALSGTLPLGYVTAYSNGAGVIQSISDSNIRQFTSGGGGGGSGAASKQITQVGHGFAPGDVLYLNGAVYAKAQANTSATAETVGIVSSVFSNDLFELAEVGYISNSNLTIFGGGTMTAGEVYFLSDIVPGKLTQVEPTNVGSISKPMLIADGPTSGYVLNYRGFVIGGTNARSQVTLANNATTQIQYVLPYDAGEIVGWVSLTNSTPANNKKFYIQIQFAKNGVGSDYYVTYQVLGDTPPVGFLVNYSANYVQIVLPNISGFISGSINYALNAPAVGTSFPLTVDGANVTAATALTQGTVSTTTQSFAGPKTLLSPLTVTPTSNQITLGTTRTVTVTAPTPATASLVHTIPDVGVNSNFIMDQGAQSITGAKTFNGLVGVGTTATTGVRLRAAATTTSEFALSVSRPAEAYALTNGAASLYSPSGTLITIGPSDSTTGIVGGALIDFLGRTTTGDVTGAFIGVQAGTVSNGPANFVIGQRTGVSTWRENCRFAASGLMTLSSFQTPDSTNAQLLIRNNSGTDVQFEAGNNTIPGISGVMRISRITSNSRSINASGTVNANGADYAEYMEKNGDFTIAKGDICGIDKNGKLTNKFDEALSFVVKSTNPSYVGNDTWCPTPHPVDEDGNELTPETKEYQQWLIKMEEARLKVDRIAFCGQVPVNVLGAKVGDYIIPIKSSNLIAGEAKSNPTFEEYMKSIGKVIAIEEDGRARIIIKIA